MSQLTKNQIANLKAGVNTVPIETYVQVLNNQSSTPEGQVINMELLESDSWRMSSERIVELRRLIGENNIVEEPRPEALPPPTVDVCSDLQSIATLNDFIKVVDSQNIHSDIINQCLGLESSDIENIRNYVVNPSLRIWDDENLPPVPQDSTDIFFIGTPKSGKTCAIAATLKNLADSGRKVLTGDTTYIIGNQYQDHLIRCMRHHVMPERTADDMSNYMSLGVMHNVNKPDQIHKWNFIEMSGERLKNTYEGVKPDINPGNWLKSKNRKVINFVIDCDYNPSDIPDDSILESAYRQLEDWGVFERTDVVNFLIVKIDVENTNDPKQFARELVQTRYNALLNTLRLQQRSGFFGGKKFVINVLPISIGDGVSLGGSYMKRLYDKYIDEFIDELTASTSYRKI